MALRMNLRALFAAAAEGVLTGCPRSPLELEALTDLLGLQVGKSTTYRLLAGTPQPLGLDRIQVIASAFGLPAWVLLQPTTAGEPLAVAMARQKAKARAQQMLKQEHAEAIAARPRARRPATVSARPPAKPGGKRRAASASKGK